jgi:hypothetical protein
MDAISGCCEFFGKALAFADHSPTTLMTRRLDITSYWEISRNRCPNRLEWKATASLKRRADQWRVLKKTTASLETTTVELLKSCLLKPFEKRQQIGRRRSAQLCTKAWESSWNLKNGGKIRENRRKLIQKWARKNENELLPTMERRRTRFSEAWFKFSATVSSWNNFKRKRARAWAKISLFVLCVRIGGARRYAQWPC